MILLDTSFLIFALAPSTAEDATLKIWLRQGEVVRTSIMVWAEFLCGPVPANQIAMAAALTRTPEPILLEDAARGADFFNQTGRRRGSLADCLIAATCLRLEAKLATVNRNDFKRFEPMGLRLAEP